MSEHDDRVARMREEFERAFTKRAGTAEGLDVEVNSTAVKLELEADVATAAIPRGSRDPAAAIAELELEVEALRDDVAELHELRRELVDERIREVLGETRRVPIGDVARRSGISADALRMRCRRLGIKTVREGRIATVAIGDVERLLGKTTTDLRG
jgi:hypothetical protein